jgi:branched-chain amino acid transport system ATP-binding protein
MTVELSLLGARAGYGPVEALHGVTMAFPAGSMVAVLGRNGAGKSTALRALAGTVRVREGTVWWRGRDITKWTAYQRALAGITMVPDEHGVFASLTVEENLALFAGDDVFDRAMAVFPELEPLRARTAGTLSGGEQQMLAVARPLLRPGRVVLVDEASRGLAPAAVYRLYEALQQLVSADRAVVVVEQYAREVLGRADVVYVLRRGDVAFAGEPAELHDGALARALG